MKWLICGGRDYEDWTTFLYHMTEIMLEYQACPTVIISGGAKGADTLAIKLATMFEVTAEVFPAQWDKHGKSAGFIRNQQMLVEGKPDLVIAFPGGRGTENMVEQALKAGVKVIDLRKVALPL